MASEARRIELGPVEIVALAAESATTSAPPQGTARPGFLVEFEIAAERLSPGSIVAAARAHLGEAAADELAQRYLEELRGSAPMESRQPAAEGEPPAAPPPEMLRIGAGRYPIGRAIEDAEFFNQTPRFERQLAAFAIDPAPSPETGLDFAAAEARCAALGKRLPTEFEWEVAARHPQFELAPGLEWTASWYLPYPGNHRSEAEYGQRFRVLRGVTESGSSGTARRHYFAPAASSSSVGFRCVADAPEAG